MVTDKLKRDIGFLGASLLVLNGLIGAGIFALPGKVALNAGLFSPWLFLIVGVLFLSVVLTFSELASYYDETGGPVLYAQEAFGQFAGFSTGWLIYLSRVAAFAANASVLAIYLVEFLPAAASPVVQAGLGAAVTIGLTLANYLGVKDGVRTMGVFTILKLLPLLLLIVLGLQEVSGATLLPPGPFTIDNLGATSLLLIYAFVGFETLGVTAGETAKPKVTLPRALLGTVIFTGVLYCLIVLVFVSVVPPENFGTATLVDVGVALAGVGGGMLIGVAAVFSIGGNLAAAMISAPRLVFAMAEQKTLPAALARVHPRYATPYVSILLTGSLALGIGLSGSFVVLAVASSVARLLGYLICIASLPAIRRRAERDGQPGSFHLPGGYSIPVLAFVICVWLIAQSQLQSWRVIGVLLTIGGLLYLLERRVLGQRLGR